MPHYPGSFPGGPGFRPPMRPPWYHPLSPSTLSKGRVRVPKKAKRKKTWMQKGRGQCKTAPTLLMKGALPTTSVAGAVSLGKVASGSMFASIAGISPTGLHSAHTPGNMTGCTKIQLPQHLELSQYFLVSRLCFKHVPVRLRWREMSARFSRVYYRIHCYRLAA